jgi:ATP-dependent RNA helicase DeaD
MDIADSFMQKGKFEKEELSLIEVKDFGTFVAVKSAKVNVLLSAMKEEKINGKSIRLK